MGGSTSAELQAALEELEQVRESEARFRKLAERASDLISRTDPSGRCIYISSSCRDLLGYEPEEIVGKLALVDLAHPDDVQQQQQVLARFVQGKTSGSPLMRRLRRKDGNYVWLEIITSIERDAEGKIVEVQSWARDVTSRVLAEQALARAEAEQKKMEQRLALAERMAIVGRLASGVGHEVNNPLAYMLGSLELARADLAALSTDVPAHERIARLERHLVTVREGAERVRDIVRDLKSLSFATDDRLGPVDVERALDLAAATAAHEIRLRARLVKKYGGIGCAEANEGRLAQVFVNLLVNAAQAIPEGAASDNEIRVVTREESGTVVVEIHDSGTGIAPEDMAHVFEPFFTTKPKGIGTGLGLSISHTIVSALGGTLTAEAASPRGALFRVTLRRSYEALAQPPSSASRARSAPRARVLVVDDEPSIVRVLADLLSPHEVTLAYSGQEAISLLARDAAFDVILCDLHMNDGTGADVYRYLGREAPHLARRVIFTTGGAFTDRAREFLGACPQPVLEKPFDTARLTALVDEMGRRVSSAP